MSDFEETQLLIKQAEREIRNLVKKLENEITDMHLQINTKTKTLVELKKYLIRRHVPSWDEES